MILRGVNRSGLEYASPRAPDEVGDGSLQQGVGDGSPPGLGGGSRPPLPLPPADADEGASRFLEAAALTRDDVREMVSGWRAGIVRLPFTQNVALDGRNGWPAEAYLRAIDRVVAWAAEAGAYTLLDLQWLDATTDRGRGQDGSVNRVPALPDARTPLLWAMLAARYRREPAVLFDLFNEPHDPLFDDLEPLLGVTLDGHLERLPSRHVGMEEWQPWARRLVQEIRSEHPAALIFVSGVRWAFDLRGFPLRDRSGTPLPGLVYSTHVYPWSRTGMLHRVQHLA